MPSQIIHSLVGRFAADRAGVSNNVVSRLFHFGCQGPDVFAHNRRTEPLGLAFSRLLHRRCYGDFCAHFARESGICEGIGKRDSVFSRPLSWFLGFVTHQCVDRVFHPYIVYRSFLDRAAAIPSVRADRYHVFFERILDAALFESLSGSAVSGFDCVNTLGLERGDYDDLVPPIARSLAMTFPLEESSRVAAESRVRNAFVDALRFYRLSDPSLTRMDRPVDPERAELFITFAVGDVALLHPNGIPESIDWLNRGRAAWRNPIDGAEKTDSVRDLFDIAVDRAARAIRSAVATAEGSLPLAEFSESIGNESLSAVGEDGNAGSVKFYAPYGLDAVLIDQAARRKRWLEGTVG